MEDKVKNLQDNLKYLRMACGVSATEFGKHLGVTRQMIYNLESGRNKMNLMEYHAIMHVLDICRCATLNYVYEALMSNCCPDEYKEYVRKGVRMYMPSVIQGVVTLDDVADSFDDYISRFA